MKNVAIAGDFFRFGVGQPKTLNWFFGLLSIAFGDIDDVNFVRLAVSDETDFFRRALGNEQQWVRYERNRDLAWAEIYDHANIESLEIFKENLDQLIQCDFVVGFELPPTLKRFLHENNVKYICFYNHPVRFLPDLCFGVTSNDADVLDILKKYELPNREINVAVKRLNAAYARLRSTPFLLPAGMPLILGQTACDASIIKAGQFAKLGDFEDVLAMKLTAFDAVCFIEHPHRGRDLDAINLLRGVLGKTVISCRGNNYGLLFCNRETAPLSIALSSSMGVEASILGIDSHFLLGDPRDRHLLPFVDQEYYFALGHNIFDKNMWNSIFFSEKFKISTYDSGFYLGENFIRNTLESWSFKAMKNGIEVEKSVRRLFPSALVSNEIIDDYLGEIVEDSHLVNRDRPKLLDMAGAAKVDMSVAPLLPTVGRPLQIEPREGVENDYPMKGFYGPENWGVWSSSPLSSIQIPVGRGHGRSTKIGLRITFKTFGDLPWIARFVKVVINGRAVGAVFATPSAIDTFSIEFEVLLERHILEISFETSKQQPPSEFIAGSQDNRPIGFGLCAIGVRIEENGCFFAEGGEQPDNWLLWNADRVSLATLPPFEVNGPMPDLSNLSGLFRLFQLKEMIWTREQQKIVGELDVQQSKLRDIRGEIKSLLSSFDIADAHDDDENMDPVTSTINSIARLKDRLIAQDQANEVAKIAVDSLSQRLAKLEGVEKLLLSERARRLDV